MFEYYSTSKKIAYYCRWLWKKIFAKETTTAYVNLETFNRLPIPGTYGRRNGVTSGLLSGKKTARRPDRFFYFLSPDLSSFLVSLHIVVEAYRVLFPSLLPPPHKRQRIGRLCSENFCRKINFIQLPLPRTCGQIYSVYTYIVLCSRVANARIFSHPNHRQDRLSSPLLLLDQEMWATRKSWAKMSRRLFVLRPLSGSVNHPLCNARSAAHISIFAGCGWGCFDVDDYENVRDTPSKPQNSGGVGGERRKEQKMGRQGGGFELDRRKNAFEWTF